MAWYQRGVWRQQWPLLTLIGVMVAIFIWQLLDGGPGYAPLMVVPAEVGESWRALREGGASWADWLEFGTLVSYAFLHADGQHILFNMIFLWMFAALAAELLGSWWMLGIFVFTAICGALCHTIFTAGDYIPMLGASGAVYGFMGAYLGMAVRWHLPNPHVWPLARPIPPAHLAGFAAVRGILDWTQVVNGAGGGVAFGAHLGGFIGGIFLTSFLARMPKAAERR